MTREEKDQLEKRFVSELLFTVGYAESENKAEFEKGARMAAHRAVEYCDELCKSMDGYKREVEYHRGNLATIATILDSYKA